MRMPGISMLGRGCDIITARYCDEESLAQRRLFVDIDFVEESLELSRTFKKNGETYTYPPSVTVRDSQPSNRLEITFASGRRRTAIQKSKWTARETNGR
jgi:hypothetical protein